MSGINASRERIDIIRNVWSSEDDGRRSKTTIRCNRLVLPLRNKDGDQSTVIRGKSLTATLHMGMAVMEAFRNSGTVNEEGVVASYANAWRESLSQYDTKVMKGNWIAVYVNGVPTFSTAESPDMDMIERLAAGGNVTETLLDEAAERFSGGGEEVHFSYDTQLAVRLTNHEKFVKCAILERNLVNEGTMSFQVARRPKVRGTIVETMALAVKIIEASTLVRQHGLFRKKERDPSADEAKEAREMMDIIKGRVSELSTAIRVIVTGGQIQFWPEEPKFVIN